VVFWVGEQKTQQDIIPLGREALWTSPDIH